MSMRAVLLILVLAALAWVLFLREPAGHSVSEGAGSYVRLVLHHARPQPEAKMEVVETLVPQKDLPRWKGVAHEDVRFTRTRPVRSQVDETQDPKRQQVSAIALSGRGPKHVTVPGSFDSQTFNQAFVTMCAFGSTPETVRVACLVGDRVVVAGPWLTLTGSEGYGQVLLFELPENRRAGVTFDGLRVEAKGTAGGKSPAVTVNRIDLVQNHPSRFLPAPGGIGDLVSIAREERRGVGLTSDVALASTFDVPEDGQLSFSLGLVEDLRVYGEQPEVRLTIEADGVEPIEQTYALESRKGDAAGWHGHDIDLAAFAGKQATAHFELSVRGDHLGLAVVAEAAISRRGEEVPTVFLITSDTHRADHMSSTGDRVQTPVLDGLARRGMLFDDAFAATNVTNPSHVSLMTALSPRDTHIQNNNTPLDGRASTLAERFAEADYRCFAAVSAYHLLHEESGLGQGFDRVNGPKIGERDGAQTLDLLDGWLKDAVGQPLFVWLHLFDAHAPYKPIAKYVGRYWEDGNPYDEDRELDMPSIKEIPPFLKNLRDKDYPYAMYRGEVDYVDELMGRLLENERVASGILAFTADHGESFGEHGVWWDHAEIYPETVRVPLILTWPNGPDGLRTNVPVEQTDVGRTLLDLAGLEEADFPGRNLIWADETPTATQPRFLISAHGFVASIHTGDWLLNLHDRDHHEWALEVEKTKHQVELYNLADDPGCLVDLAKDEAHFERAKLLRQRLIDWLNSGERQGLGTSKVMTAAAADSLKELGYSGGDEGRSSGFETDPENWWDQYFGDGDD